MDEQHALGVSAPAQGFARSVVDDFVAHAAEERVRLEQVIAEAERREESARAAASTYEVMLTMLLESQHELARRRVDAEREAAELIEAADRQAREILGEVEESPEPPAIDLVEAATDEELDRSVDDAEASTQHGFGVPVYAGALANGHDDAGAEGYFDFLRGALVDDEPLGPRDLSEQAR